MNIAEKFGRWFVVVLWSCAGAFCVFNVWFSFAFVRNMGRLLKSRDVVMFDSTDAWFTLAAIVFLAGAYGVARRLRWARTVSLGLWGLYGYWNFGAFNSFGDMPWFPRTALALWFLALLWLMSSAAMEPSREVIRH
jgi:hypothetical protein